MAIACKHGNGVCNCVHGSRRQIFCPAQEAKWAAFKEGPEYAALRKRVCELVDRVKAEQKAASAAPTPPPVVKVRRPKKPPLVAITPALAIAPPLGGEPDLSVATNHYRDHQDELVALYPGQYLVLVGTHLHGAYPSLPQAYRTAREELPQASFLIQECQPGEQANTQVYATPNVAFFSSSR